MRVPTLRQYQRLWNLTPGNCGFGWKKEPTDPLLRWGWVTAQFDGEVYQWVRITPEGLRALAAGMETHGPANLPVP